MLFAAAAAAAAGPVCLQVMFCFGVKLCCLVGLYFCDEDAFCLA